MVYSEIVVNPTIGNEDKGRHVLLVLHVGPPLWNGPDGRELGGLDGFVRRIR